MNGVAMPHTRQALQVVIKSGGGVSCAAFDHAIPLFHCDEEPSFIVNEDLAMACKRLVTAFPGADSFGIQELCQSISHRLFDKLP